MCEVEGRLVELRRVLGLEPTEADADDPALAVLRGVAHRLLSLLERVAADDVGGQANLDAMTLARLLGAVAVTAEDLVPVDAAAHPLRRREDPLDVDRAVGGGLAS